MSNYLWIIFDIAFVVLMILFLVSNQKLKQIEKDKNNGEYRKQKKKVNWLKWSWILCLLLMIISMVMSARNS